MYEVLQGDIIDSRDIINRIEELEGQEDRFQEEQEELEVLKELAEECEDYGDWRYGTALISEDYFVQYCKELIQDIGDIPKDIPSYIAIDWDKTAENLRADYTPVDVCGETFWIRN